jgi:FixJ family two-component response regulator
MENTKMNNKIIDCADSEMKLVYVECAVHGSLKLFEFMLDDQQYTYVVVEQLYREEEIKVLTYTLGVDFMQRSDAIRAAIALFDDRTRLINNQQLAMEMKEKA